LFYPSTWNHLGPNLKTPSGSGKGQVGVSVLVLWVGNLVSCLD